MPRYDLLPCLMALIFLGLSGSDEPNLLMPSASEMPTDADLSLLDEDAGSHECSACVWREQSKVLRLETIKSQILSKLRLKQAPNISREVVNQLLPKAPPLQQLLDHHDFQVDASAQDEFMEEDEYHATTESVITMASERKSHRCIIQRMRLQMCVLRVKWICDSIRHFHIPSACLALIVFFFIYKIKHLNLSRLGLFANLSNLIIWIHVIQRHIAFRWPVGFYGCDADDGFTDGGEY